MIGDINSNSYNFLEFVDDIEVDFPNTSVTSMNLKSVKARYLIKDKRYDDALNLLNTIEYDPLKMSESQKAEIFYSKSEIFIRCSISISLFSFLPIISSAW